MGCETLHLRSIVRILNGCCILLVLYASASMALQGGLVSWYPRFPSLLWRRYTIIWIIIIGQRGTLALSPRRSGEVSSADMIPTTSVIDQEHPQNQPARAVLYVVVGPVPYICLNVITRLRRHINSSRRHINSSK